MTTIPVLYELDTQLSILARLMHHSLVPCHFETGPYYFLFGGFVIARRLEQSIQYQAYDDDSDAGRGPERARVSVANVKSYVNREFDRCMK